MERDGFKIRGIENFLESAILFTHLNRILPPIIDHGDYDRNHKKQK